MFHLPLLNSPRKDVGVLIHGCHLEAEGWERIVFGEGDQLGRVPVGLAEAVNRNAKLIFWGSGGSVSKDGLKESEYTYAKVFAKLEHLARQVDRSPAELAKFVKEVSFLDTKSKNTEQEIKAALRQCRARGIKELILISSPTHIARCLQEACKLKVKKKPFPIAFYARPCDTCFANSKPYDVVIIEPPLRIARHWPQREMPT